MSNVSAAELAQRAIDAKLITASELDYHFRELDITEMKIHEFSTVAIAQMLLTNFQISKLIDGKVDGFYFGKHKVMHLIDTEEHVRVYRGENVETKESVTIRVLRNIFKNDPVVRQQFAREAKLNGREIEIDQDRVYVVIVPPCN